MYVVNADGDPVDYGYFNTSCIKDVIMEGAPLGTRTFKLHQVPPLLPSKALPSSTNIHLTSHLADQHQ